MIWRKRTNLITYLGEKSEFQGDLHVEGSLRIDGIIHGNVEVIGDVEVSQGGLVEGPEIRAHNLIVHGVIKARVYVQGRLSLSRTARLEGDVTASSLDIEPGAFYLGHISTTDVKALPVTDRYPELVGDSPQAQYAEYTDKFKPE
ncbi:MAG: polymer-forming cytoskeletal protein [Synechococcales bacterium]|nr:polymer-forming cytoskeletal protein [Synechococcales bacterium]